MSIWEYGDGLDSTTVVRSAVEEAYCPFCNAALEALGSHEELTPAAGVDLSVTRAVRVCPVCGWWTSTRTEFTALPQYERGRIKDRMSNGPHERRVFAATACLRQLRLDDLSLPIEDVRAYLAAKYDARLQVHPRKFEEVVGSVFADHGYRARVTAYSGDDGLDVILDGPDGAVVGVQVKRYRERISVEQIRSLAGALILNGITRGMFVTTSTFQSGAQGTSARFADRGLPIELVDAPSFLDALHIAQRNRYATRDDADAPFHRARHVLVSSEDHPLFMHNFLRRMDDRER